MPDIRRPEEPLGIRLDEQPLRPLGSSAPDREAAVTVVVGQDHQKRALLADEERRRTVTQALAGLGQPQADLADPLQHAFPLGGLHASDPCTIAGPLVALAVSADERADVVSGRTTSEQVRSSGRTYRAPAG